MQIMSFFLMLVTTPDAEAKKKKNEGVEVTFVIMEQDTQEPISTASVRHPSDIESSRVNELNGTWQSSFRRYHCKTSKRTKPNGIY